MLSIITYNSDTVHYALLGTYAFIITLHLFKVYSASSSLSPDGSHKSSCAIIGVDTTLLLLISNLFNAWYISSYLLIILTLQDRANIFSDQVQFNWVFLLDPSRGVFQNSTQANGTCYKYLAELSMVGSYVYYHTSEVIFLICAHHRNKPHCLPQQV